MSELGFLLFGSADEVDPVEAVQKTAAAIENITRELDEHGITAFALQADSAPEVEQRLLMREVNAAIDEIVERYLPEDDDAKKRVVSNIFRQFEARKNDGKEEAKNFKSAVSAAAAGTALLDPEVKLTPESRSGIKAGTHCKFCAEPLDRPEVPDPDQPIEPEGAHRSCLDSRIYGGTWCSGCDQPIASDDADAVQLKRTRMHQPCAKEFLDTYGKDEYMQRYIQGDSDEQLEEFRRQRAEEYKKKKEEEAAAAAAALRESVDAPPPSNGRGSSN